MLCSCASCVPGNPAAPAVDGAERARKAKQALATLPVTFDAQVVNAGGYTGGRFTLNGNE